MKRYAASLLVLYSGFAFAAEGMWQPYQLPELKVELSRAGLQLDPAGLTRLTDHPMNAVIDLRGCTGSFVSPTGLLVTNFHCAEGSLQYNSDEEHNLLDEGFLAGTHEDELEASPGNRVRVTVEVREITDAMTRGLDKIQDGAERYKTIEQREKRQVADCEKDVGHRCKVTSFFGGLSYFLVKQLEIRDVRLVYAPPGAIGAFGGEIDNWMWPRHTGDFAFLRAYVGPDGRPADFAKDNVPYRPKHFLRIAPGGLESGDFVMVLGYPGRTNRYRLASEVENAFGWFYPTSKALFDGALAIIGEQVERFPDAKIKYATTVAGLNNASKNYQGMLDGFAKGDMLERKRRFESELQAWIASSEALKREHLSTLRELESAVLRVQATQERDLILRRIDRTAMLSSARRLYRLSREKQKPDPEREPGYQERDWTLIRQRLERLERRYHPEVDKAALRLFLERYRQLPRDRHVQALDAFLGLNDPAVSLEAKLDAMFRETRLGEGEVRLGLMEARREQLEASEDPFIRLAVALYDSDIALENEEKALDGELQRLRPRYMQTVIAFLRGRGRPVYADANGSLRITYGGVEGYSPRDGVFFTPFTRLEGIREKFTGAEPFDSPAAQLRGIDARDYGPYRSESVGSVPVNFLSTVDTTGGNSGSPTLNGKGELVGLLFDGTYDSINADWHFDEQTTRSIHVDIRYMLWVMRKVDEATRVLEELGL